MNPRDLRATILSSVPPISIPLHARQELIFELYLLLVNYVPLIVSESVSSRRGHENEGSLEKAETNIERAHIVVLVVCACVVDWWSIGFLEYL